jgi:hypothetical protein
LEFIKSIYNGEIIENDKKTIINPITNHWLELDIYLPDINKAIEQISSIDNSIKENKANLARRGYDLFNFNNALAELDKDYNSKKRELELKYGYDTINGYQESIKENERQFIQLIFYIIAHYLRNIPDKRNDKKRDLYMKVFESFEIELYKDDDDNYYHLTEKILDYTTFYIRDDMDEKTYYVEESGNDYGYEYSSSMTIPYKFAEDRKHIFKFIEAYNKVTSDIEEEENKKEQEKLQKEKDDRLKLYEKLKKEFE